MGACKLQIGEQPVLLLPLGQEILPGRGLLSAGAVLRPDLPAAGIEQFLQQLEGNPADVNTLMVFLRHHAALPLELALSTAFRSIQLSNAVHAPGIAALEHENREGYSSEESEAEEQKGLCPEVPLPSRSFLPHLPCTVSSIGLCEPGFVDEFPPTMVLKLLTILKTAGSANPISHIC